MAKGKSAFRITSNRIPEFLAAFDKERQKRLFEAATTVRDHLIKSKLTGERTGKMYKVPGTNTYYRASVPGQPPATRLGDLRRSYGIHPNSPKRIKNNIVRLGSNLDYAYYLEKRMNREHLLPAMLEQKDAIMKILAGRYEFK